jgi:hypothetical protein
MDKMSAAVIWVMDVQAKDVQALGLNIQIS